MRRRRQKNTLLPKMIGIAVVVNAILIPILAQLGVFKAGHTHYTEVKLVKLPPLEKKPPTPKKKEPPKRKIAKAHPTAKPSSGHIASRPSRPNPNQPKVVVASGGTGNSGGPTIDNSGTGKAGQPPTASPAPPPTSVTPPLAPAPPPAPVVPPPAPVTPPPPAPTPPHDPVLVAATVLSEPKPRLPDDFSLDSSPNPFRAVFTIHPDGTASVKMLTSTGNSELDKFALDAARQWAFKPATRDGVPVESYLRLAVEFEVS